MPHDARLVLLNGPSSAGKSTVASAFRERRAAAGDFWLVIGIDDYLSKLPSEWSQGVNVTGSRSTEGIWFEPSSTGVVPRVGFVGRKLLRAYQGAVAAAAHLGLNVLVDDVVIDRTAWEDWNTALAGLDRVWVGIRCAAEVCEARERTRGDRPSGLARGLSAVVHEHVRYDFELDTTTQSPEDTTGDLVAYLGY